MARLESQFSVQTSSFLGGTIAPSKGRLESRFSMQVTQPYYLDVPFPVVVGTPRTQERLFKHLTFYEDNPSITLRLRSINQSYVTESTVLQKHVPTALPVTNIQEEKFRVKAVLSEEVDGILDSHWVVQKNANSSTALSLNQYRMRGVAKEGWPSDWVYSELRDKDNDLIIYNMLYDILDLLANVHDDQLDYLMDYMVTDTFIRILRESMPHIATKLDPEETTTAGILEVISYLTDQNIGIAEKPVVALGERFLVLADEMKKEFKENVMASAEEFSALYRIYNLFEQYQTKNTDAFELLMEIFLEDRLDKLVKKANLEVLLQNEEEMGIYLNGVYEMDIKSELITSLYAGSMNDHFVTKINDAVQLLSDPLIFEALTVHPQEEVERFLLLVLKELYAPMQAIDKHFVLLETDLEDAPHLSIEGGIVDYALFEGDVDHRFYLVRDVIETLIQGDLDLQARYESEILEKLLASWVDTRKALLVDYYFEEVLDVLLSMGESFRYGYTKQMLQPKEQQQASIIEQSATTFTKEKASLKESYHAVARELVQQVSLKVPTLVQEPMHTTMAEVVYQRYLLFKQAIHEFISTMAHDQATIKDITATTVFGDKLTTDWVDQAIATDIVSYLKAKESTFLLLMDTAISKDITSLTAWKEKITTIPEDTYYNLFKHFLREPHAYTILEKQDNQLTHELKDMYFLTGEEFVHFVLGPSDSGWPVGIFKLGTNTLKGEVS